MEKKQFGVEPAKIDKEPEYRDVKPADQSGDNDMDKMPPPVNDEAKKETDEAYLKNSAGSGPAPNKGRE